MKHLPFISLLNKATANQLRLICANDKYCDVNALNNTLQEKGL